MHDIEAHRDGHKRWAGFKPFVVERRVKENALVTSFYLSPVDGEPLPAYRPGQFLTFEFYIEGQKEPLIRQYSLSAGPGNDREYCISVKREGPPLGAKGVPPGLVSNFLHDNVQEGDTLQVMAPRGHFYLDETSDRPVVLLSGGIGITPMMSMAEALANADSGRPVWFVHACENAALHAFKQEIEALSGRYEWFHHFWAYANPVPEEIQGRDYDLSGFVTREALQNLLPLDDYEFYLCGPPPFMQAMYGHIKALGVSDERIKYEFFGPSTILKPLDEGAGKTTGAESLTCSPETGTGAVPADGDGDIIVVFRGGGLTKRWDPSFASLLDFAEAQGLSPEFSCRAGICNSCLCPLVAGEVEYIEEPLEQPEGNQVLICCSRPKSSVVIDI